VLKAIWTRAWGDPLVIGFGDSEDDVAWLRDVDVAIFVQNDQSGVPARVLSKLPNVHVTHEPGRQGWSEAIFEFVGALLKPQQPGKPTNELGGRAEPRSENRPP
jgi:hypothetical protein